MVKKVVPKKAAKEAKVKVKLATAKEKVTPKKEVKKVKKETKKKVVKAVADSNKSPSEPKYVSIQQAVNGFVISTNDEVIIAKNWKNASAKIAKVFNVSK